MRKLSPSELRLAELCCVRRPLTDAEQGEVARLKRVISNCRAQRRRYRNDSEYRERIKRAKLQRYHEARA